MQRNRISSRRSSLNVTVTRIKKSQKDEREKAKASRRKGKPVVVGRHLEYLVVFSKEVKM
jgi:hypothetical protein